MNKANDNTVALKVAGPETKCSGNSNQRSRSQKKHHLHNKTVALDLAIGSDSSTCSSGLSSSSETSSFSSSSSTTPPNRLKNHNKQKKQQTNQSSQRETNKRHISKRPLHSTTRTTTYKAKDQYVALDCEMVGVGQDGKTSALARVTIIDWDGNIFLDEYVKPDTEVTDYRTFVSGITEEHLVNYATLNLLQCRQIVLEILRNKIIIGHALENDLRALGIDHPWYQIRDTAKYDSFMKVRFNDGVLWPRKLKDLSRERLGREIQVIGKPHSPFEDALAALDLYKLVQKPWETVIEQQFRYLYLMQKQLQENAQWESYNVNTFANNYNCRYYTTDNIKNNYIRQQPQRVGHGTPISHPPASRNMYGSRMYFQSAQST